MTTRAHGIDVSQVQRSVDWGTVARAGFSFAYVKATEGISYRDPMFQNHVDGARAAGLLVGAYHVLEPLAPAADQVKNFALFAGSLNLELPPVLDFELPAPESWGRRVDPHTLAPHCLAAAKALSNLWRDPLIYTYPYFAHQLPRGPELTELATVFGLWIASYRDEKHVPDDDAQPSLPEPWFGGWSFWQYSGDHGLAVPGVAGACDRNLFNGTEASLRQQAAHTDASELRPIHPSLYEE